jgi:hypothetical protein
MMSRGNVKLFSKLFVLSMLACAAVPFGCSTSETKLAPSALTDGAAGSAGSAGSAGAASVLKCGSTDCEPKAGIGIEKITRCCTDNNECGFQFPGATKCLPGDQVGTLSAACGNYTVPDVPNLRLSGCCGPQGCGKLDAFLGCIVNTDLGLAAQSCAYDPSNDCSYIESVGCDGSEDCPTGQRCCSALADGNVSRTGCYDSCSALITSEQTANWRELCHTTAECEDPTFECRTSQSLPPWLFRCFSGLGNPAATTFDTSAGSVNCGANLVCKNGQKCCLGQSASTGQVSYCVDQNAECKCHPPDGG